MTKWTAADLPDMTGRTVVVTGATSGIGLITARELARAGACVVLAVRSVARGQAVADTFRGRTEVRELDVADLASIRRFAAHWSGAIDVLVNNAGIMAVPLSRTADGFELQLATNYFGPFVLTNLLLPHITDRVVSVSSQLHRMGRTHLRDVADLTGRHRRYNATAAYNDSKLNLMLFSTELQRRLAASGSPARSLIAHPGIAATNLASRSAAGKVTRVLGFLFNDAEHGALPSLYAATQDLPGNSYVGPSGPGGLKGHPEVRRPAAAALDPSAAARLWALTARLTGTGADLPAAA
ncbi:SDR family NAD(P)-dependent oxidoreductase [Streptomyces sp. NPDC007264]|uniref:SDR family NAD(P)-dependent oxidoreductase n=1 Tax=Streptomyces sp. NPDC007264 TaxID=3364777 RepID=UPI0036DC7AB7